MTHPKDVQEWFILISRSDQTLGDAYEEMRHIALEHDSIPMIVQLVENPKYDLPGIDIFSGATDLATHDYIHILLGRGVMPKDEAFVLGFTMGSTNRIGEQEEKLYGVFSRFLYPKNYCFTNDDFKIYKDAVRLGYISDCKALNTIDYTSMSQLTLDEAREQIGLEKDLLAAYYQIAAKRHPNILECRRLND